MLGSESYSCAVPHQLVYLSVSLLPLIRAGLMNTQTVQLYRISNPAQVRKLITAISVVTVSQFQY